MGYWTAKVVPKFKKLFDKNSAKKAAAAEASKTFDESKVYYYELTKFNYVNYVVIGPMRHHYYVHIESI